VISSDKQELNVMQTRTKKIAVKKTKKKKIKQVRLLEQGRVRVQDVLTLPSHNDLDRDLVSSIAESFPLSGGGPFHSIVVRRVSEEVDGEEVTKTELVAGAHRLEAARWMNLKYINCTYFEGDDTEARIVQISENIFRKGLTVLKHAELLGEWTELAKAKGYFSGQLVRKGKLGRPLGGLSMNARELPVVGRSFEARRKIIERAIKIARISPKAKEAAIAAGLDNNQKALLKIAKASGRKAQVRKVKELAEALRNAIGMKPRTEYQDGDLDDDAESPPLQPTTDDKAVTYKSPAGKKTNIKSSIADTTLETLETMWKRQGQKLWAYTPVLVREQFIGMLRRARCKASADLSEFIANVFWGRGRIGAQELYAFAKSKGFPKKLVRNTLKARSYLRKKDGRTTGALWYYSNKDSGWTTQSKMVSDTELNAPLAPEREKEEQAIRRHLSDDEYYSMST
jgi:hypothetical protein